MKNFEYDGIVYQVSEDGRIFGKRGEIKQRRNKDGYLVVTLGSGTPKDGFEKRGSSRKAFRVHRIVAMCYIPNPENKATVNHIDFNRENNSVENLEWLTQSENVKHSVQAGNHIGVRAGTKNGRATIDENEVKFIRDMYDIGDKTIQEIADRLNMSWSTVNHIVKRKSWKEVA